MFAAVARNLSLLWLRFARLLILGIGYVLACYAAYIHFEGLPGSWCVGLTVLYIIVQWFNTRLCSYYDIREVAKAWRIEDCDGSRNALASALGRVEYLIDLPITDLITIWMSMLPLYLGSLGIDAVSAIDASPYWFRAALAFTLPPFAQAVAWGRVYYVHYVPEVTTIRGRERTSFEEARDKEGRGSASTASLFWGGLRLAIDRTLTHFVLLGNNRSGKTVNLRLLMQSAFCQTKSACKSIRALVFDPKTTFVPLLVGLGISLERIRILNPFDARCWAWDIAADIQTPTDATNIAAILIPESKHGEHEFFQPAARDILASEMIAFHLTCPGKWTFRDLLLVNWTPDRVEALLKRTSITRHTLDRYAGDHRTLANITASLRKSLVLYEPIASCWEQAGENRMSLNEWSGTDKILILGHDDVAKEQLAAINRCIFERVTNLLLSGEPNPNRSRTWIVLDEAREWGKLAGLHSILVRGAEYSVNAILGFQSVQGMWEVYGENSAGELIGQANNLAVFRLGNDRKTAEWAADMIGKAQRLEKYRSQTQGREVSQTTSESSHDRHLYMPEELQVLNATSPEHGLQGVFVSEQYGVVDAAESGITGDKLFGELLLPPDESIARFVPRPHEHHYLQDWSPADRQRLGLHDGVDSLCQLPRL